MKKQLIFSERYSSIIEKGDLTADFSSQAYEKINNCLNDFDEIDRIYPCRYDSYTVDVLTSEKAYETLCEKHGWEKEKKRIDAEWLAQQGYVVVFDLIELWYSELSSGEQIDFQKNLNEIFDDFDQPWRIVNGKMYHIDPTQFERDLQLKHLELLNEIACSIPVFQSALNEYLSAIDAYKHDDYKNCVLEAEKSYESALKIACNIESKTAKDLIGSFANIDSVKNSLPSTMKPEGFRDNVLKTLPYIRNNCNVGHGDGLATVQISKPMAKLSLDLCASLCTYVINIYKKEKKVYNDDDLPF